MQKRVVGGGGPRLGFTGRAPIGVHASLDLSFSLLSTSAGSVLLKQRVYASLFRLEEI